MKSVKHNCVGWFCFCSFASKQNWAVSPAGACILLLPREAETEPLLQLGLGLLCPGEMITCSPQVQRAEVSELVEAALLEGLQAHYSFVQTLSHTMPFSELQPSLLDWFQWLISVIKERKCNPPVFSCIMFSVVTTCWNEISLPISWKFK